MESSKLNQNWIKICPKCVLQYWRAKVLRYLNTGTCRRGWTAKKDILGYLTMGSRHYHLRWTLQDLKWIFNNQRCQVVASLPSSKQFWEEQRRRGGAILSKMHRWRFAIFGCNFRPCILHWVLVAFFTPSQTGKMCTVESTSRCADSLSKHSPNPARIFFRIECQPQ